MKLSHSSIASLLLVSSLLAGCANKPLDPRLVPCRDALNLYDRNENVNTLAMGRQLYDLAGQCVAQNPPSPKVLRTMYLIQADAASERMHDYAKAITAMESAIRLNNGTNPRDTLTLSRYYRLNGQREKALELVQGNIDNGLGETGKGTGFHMPTYYHLGQALYDLGRYREAAEAFSAGLRQQKDYAWAYWERGRAYDSLQQTDDARRDFQRFAQLVNKDYIGLEQRSKLAQYQIPL